MVFFLVRWFTYRPHPWFIRPAHVLSALLIGLQIDLPINLIIPIIIVCWRSSTGFMSTSVLIKGSRTKTWQCQLGLASAWLLFGESEQPLHVKRLSACGISFRLLSGPWWLFLLKISQLTTLMIPRLASRRFKTGRVKRGTVYLAWPAMGRVRLWVGILKGRYRNFDWLIDNGFI